ncbi:disease resistance protein Roq1-like [Argentina anserina]|uniref:disease resistance protein Roq1-like n=1 Tax=Argentina anserina TaxID=57926 RepID=UPI0021767068|nr:disease resistance protein Roq1-like [Potentilla anserina]
MAIGMKLSSSKKVSEQGADTRVGFISHLYDELAYWQAIRTFKDDRELQVGASISPELLSAIEQSHLAIVVLSPNYATSGWCLDELANIIESMETRNNTILPVFFHVDLCHVRYQRGSFAQAFAKHEERYGNGTDKLNKWRAALAKVASLSGWDLKNYESERELIKVIVKCVWSKVRPTITLLNSTDKLVGIDFRLVELGILLAPEANDVRFIGLCGMSGIGKTTLAKLVYERISHQFEVSKFLSNVREVSLKHGTLVELQKQLLSPILKEKIAQIWDEQEGTSFTRKCLFNKKVLLIVDDVDHCWQLEILVGNKSWFGNGSRIIVTSRDKRLLIERDIETLYEVERLSPNKSLELFSQNAFCKDKPEEDFAQMSECFEDYSKGLPLALKVLGRSLYKRDIGAWKSALDKLKKNPVPAIFDTLKLSL